MTFGPGKRLAAPVTPPMIKSPSPLALLACAALFTASPLLAQAEKKEQPATPQKRQKQPPVPGAGTGGITPHATTSTLIGANRQTGGRVTIIYGRPNVKHPRTGEVRKVWGGLEGWDKPYRLGADEATLFITEKPLDVGGTTLPAGAYTLYLVPSQSGPSKLAFSKKLGGWGVPVDTTQDFARVELKQEKLDTIVEQLTITIENDPPKSSAGALKIEWDDMRWTLPFSLKTA